MKKLYSAFLIHIQLFYLFLTNSALAKFKYSWLIYKFDFLKNGTLKFKKIIFHFRFIFSYKFISFWLVPPVILYMYLKNLDFFETFAMKEFSFFHNLNILISLIKYCLHIYHLLRSQNHFQTFFHFIK